MNKSEIVKTLWEKEGETQTRFLEVFSETRRVDPKVLKELECFFIPNSKYLVEVVGPIVLEYENGLYSNSQCIFVNTLVIPQKDVTGDVVAFVGYDFITKLEDKEKGVFGGPYYKDNNRDIYKATDYLFWVGDSFDRAWELEYVIIVDGVFDAINLWAEGFPTVAFLGSDVTNTRVMQLVYIDNWFVARDNDTAGTNFYTTLKRHNPGKVFSIKQNVGKDADDALASDSKEEYLKGIRYAVDSKTDYSLVVKPNINGR